MTEEMAELSLLSMGVPEDMAHACARWIAGDIRNGNVRALIYSARKQRGIMFDNTTGETRSSNYFMRGDTMYFARDEHLVYSPTKGFSPTFRHDETSLT